MHDRPNLSPPWRIGIDIGGTFTDLVLIDAEGLLRQHKASTTTNDPSEGVIDVLRLAADAAGLSTASLLGGCSHFVHGSTIATNTLLEAKGAKVGLLVTEGFRDALEIRRGMREDPWEHRTPFPLVLVPRSLRLPIRERTDKAGQSLVPLDDESVRRAVGEMQSRGVEAVAIAFLNSFINSQHEHECKELVRSLWPDAWVYASSDMVRMVGEYERTSTVVLNAYVAPRVVPYLRRLELRLKEYGLKRPLLLMQSNGGVVSVQQVEQRPASLLLSGPSAGASALMVCAKALGSQDLISIEIGGTSCDVILTDDTGIAMTNSTDVNGYHLALPAVDIHTVSAGGGTIARRDQGGMLRAGPDGAGAFPGPACYSRGGVDPTVTDAQLVLGRLQSGRYGGGLISLEKKLAEEAINNRIAAPSGLTIVHAAAGIIRLMEQEVIHAVEKVSVERGFDPSRFTLVAVGGAGAMHGASVARALGCRTVFVPRVAGVFCAFGMCTADARQDVVSSWLKPLATTSASDIDEFLHTLASECRKRFIDEGFEAQDINIESALELQYKGQQSSVIVPIEKTDTSAIRRAFLEQFRRLYAHDQGEDDIVITGGRAVGSVHLGFTEQKSCERTRRKIEPTDLRPVYWEESDNFKETPVFEGDALKYGDTIDGPALVESSTTTVIVPEECHLDVDSGSNFLIHVNRMPGAS
ncbi:MULTISPECIES: hydantoinase/oxoprolinase family protein [unclassified Mesorhizobium]|uniref:hydantoinase/oxoprolinase family protein n=1 Tax=unclassified Mesorhizobium TaxID=325217 RepID=UPI000FD29EE4|nr:MULTISPECIES: hydantoinase/oxoprolinase family protein [unclassified Mesorhizobium]RUU78477.1 hydantoinase/oxoprolinase family protein [Mesorhizobium sp. M7A.F.Ca.MR.362.00.0.0]RWN85894.1 MAG: hydantoinase/oxoprolinase family protein [Mesorhizobium sp.]RWO93965.1 MAG: hydantoinase/oxoprolinase family protein [Mesorhizobium sp.]TIM52132.1 MAG: hydantoinase/oxoprolinase family protein [Mesorhizobium sp.]